MDIYDGTDPTFVSQRDRSPTEAAFLSPGAIRLRLG
jgi:hypothetical protein